MSRRFLGGMIGGLGLMVMAISSAGSGVWNDRIAFFGLIAAIVGLRLFVVDPTPVTVPPSPPEHAPAPPPPRPTPRAVKMDRAQALGSLGLRDPFSAAELRASYAARLKRCHPDRVSGLAPEIVETAERETKRLNAAFEFLSKN